MTTHSEHTDPLHPDAEAATRSGAPITLASPSRYRDALPAEVDVAVIGGGVIGVFAALELARSGRSVLVLEKGRIAGEQSSRNWGWVRQQGRHRSELPIMMEAVARWAALDEEAHGRTGFQRTGTCVLARDEAEMERLSSWIATARAHGLATRMFGREEAARLVAGAKPGLWIGGIVTESDARAEPSVAVPVAAALAHEHGVTIRESCAVRALEVTNGRVVGVLTEDGPVRAGSTILAGGAWSSLLARAHGLSMPQLSVSATVARTAPLPELYRGNASDDVLAFRRRADGGYSLAVRDRNEHSIGPDSFRHLKAFAPTYLATRGAVRLRLRGPRGLSAGPDGWRTPRRWAADEPSPFESVRVADPAPSEALVAEMREAFAERFPHIGRPAITGAWGGMIDTMPDELPVLDLAPRLAGLVVATGMSGHGFGIGPGMGAAAARLATDAVPAHDLAPFSLKRFAKGAPRARSEGALTSPRPSRARA